MGSQQNRSSSKLAWFFTGFFILVVSFQIFLGFAYNISSTPPALIIFNGLITLITFALALFQIFPGGMQSFFVSLHIADLGRLLLRKAPITALSLILIVSLSFNLYLVLPKTRTSAPSDKGTPSAASTSTAPPTTATLSASFSSGSLQEYQIPTSNSRPVAFIRGPDGNFWFTEEQGNKIARITPQGQFTEFLIPTPQCIPGGLVHGSDGNLWFYENKGNKIGRITPQGEITEFTVPSPGSSPSSPFAGPDSTLWFIDDTYHIRRITPSSIFLSAFTLNPPPTSRPYGLTIGQDKTIWFIEPHGNMIGRITPN